VTEHVAAARLWQATQVHGDTVIDAGQPEGTKADALVASTPGDAVGIRVADCVPILLAAVDGRVAAVHAGWRGVVNGIIGKAAARIRPRVAAVGPHIGPCCFEVGRDVAKQIGFVDREVDRGSGGVPRAFVNLRRAVHEQLKAAGVSVIDDVGECTKCHPETYHSVRRDAEASGRMIAVIVARAT
jgi:YfiH family protein